MGNGRGLNLATITAVVVARTLGELCQDVSQIAGIPGLSVAGGLVLTILALCQTASVNKTEAQLLAERCVTLLQFLADGVANLTPDQGHLFTEAVNHVEQTLRTVEKQFQSWARYGKVERIILSQRISGEMSTCHTQISQCLQALGFAADLDSKGWQQRIEQARVKDHEEITSRLDSLAEGQFESASQLNTLVVQSAEMRDALTQAMGLFQESLQKFELGDRRHTDLQAKLHNVKEATGELPPLLHLQGKEVRRIGQHPVGMGAQFDIWEGEYMGKEKVALKILRGVQAKPKQFERFVRESNIWRQVWLKDRGQYILAYYGTVDDDGPYPYMVSPWQRNGTAISWVQKHPDVPRLPLIKGIAKGLELLHSWEPEAIVHGDIKGENILIGDRGQALITDFSLSKILENVTGTPFTQSKGISDSYRWFAPEVCSAPGVLSPESDIFAFAMTILELITGQSPYQEVRRTTEVLFNMQKGLRPTRPQGPIHVQHGLTDAMWDLIQACWAHDPAQRINIHEFLRRLERIR